MRDAIVAVISQPAFLAGWLVLSLLCIGLLARDLTRANPEIGGLMKVVWGLTVFYSGPIGLSIYWTTGRKQIATDSIWRRGWRSTAHCYSGCGMGEIVGLVIAVGLLALATWATALLTFVFAFAFGLALTVGPLMQDGVPFGTALRDGLTSETASIVVMEVVAIGVDLWLSGGAGLGDVLFWSSLVVSLSLGLLAAWPVNVALVALGVKEGMHDPREMATRATG
ncbi:MAG: DUF4396 domain-containing protein [Paracoccaceae bacterium]|jgi:hypothetical protein|nr:DUF4396 domain-containing protein [Paracoccaceae bacterium]